MTKIDGVSPETLEKMKQLQWAMSQHPQVHIPTQHVIHEGMYARTIHIPKDVILMGAHICVPTIVVLSGDADVSFGETWNRFSGYHVFIASAGRKQLFKTHAETDLTMLMVTSAKSVQEAEEEFTDEAENLLSRAQLNYS